MNSWGDLLRSVPISCWDILNLTFFRLDFHQILIKISQANAFVYGWGGNSIFAVSLWIIARLSQSAVRGSFLLITAGALWNLAITAGLLGILDGHMLGHELLEMPKEVWPALFVSYLILCKYTRKL